MNNKKTSVVLSWSVHSSSFSSFARAVMDPNLENCDVSKRSNKSTQKVHSGEKAKCCQCDFASAHAGNLGRHMKVHSREKTNQCDFASAGAGNLRRHFKLGKRQISASSVTIHPPGHTL